MGKIEKSHNNIVQSPPYRSNNIDNESTDSKGLVETSATPESGIRWQVIREELRKKESTFIKLKEYSIFVGTWNVNGKDVGERLVPLFTVALETGTPDIIFIGLQEMDRRPEAYLVSMSSKEMSWNSFLLDQIRNAYNNEEYVFTTSRSLVGIYAGLFIKKSMQGRVNNISTAIAPCGLLGTVGNKGAAAIRVKIDCEYVCFISSHLAAHGFNVSRRNQDYVEICRQLIFPPTQKIIKTKVEGRATEEIIATWGDVNDHTMIWDSAVLIWCGDLNYRITMDPQETLKKALSGQYKDLLVFDQLKNEIANQRSFQGFIEGPISFPPSYKYNVGSSAFDSKANPRPPAWTDRILFKNDSDRLKIIAYDSLMDLKSSDHKPVFCLFQAKIGSIDQEVFDKAFEKALRVADQLENEAIPCTIVSVNVLDFSQVIFKRPVTKSFELLNVGQSIASFKFIAQNNNDNDNANADDYLQVCPAWMSFYPLHGMIIPGSSIEIKLTVNIDTISANEFNKEKSVPECTCILHIEGGRDHFISVDASFRKTPFCRELTELTDLTGVMAQFPFSNLTFERIPWAVSVLVEHIVRFGLEQEGLFIESGDPEHLNMLQDFLDAGESIPDTLTNEMALCSVAEMLLCFLDALPDPIIPYDYYDAFIQTEGRSSEIALLLEAMPKAHVAMYKYLLHFIKHTLLYHASYPPTLSPENAASIFGNVLLKSPQSRHRRHSREASSTIINTLKETNILLKKADPLQYKVMLAVFLDGDNE